jgi:hypothetical protein
MRHIASPRSGQKPVEPRSIAIDHVGGLPLILSFEPDALRDHWEGEEDLTGLTDHDLAEIGLMALCDDALWNAFHYVLDVALTDFREDR